MSQIRNKLFINIFWGMMGLYLLNISVDSPDPEPDHIPEDLTINDQESIAEIIIEQVLGYQNAIKEYDDHEPEDSNTNISVKLNLINHYSETNIINQLAVSTAKKFFLTPNSYLTRGFHQLDTPPPKN